MSHRIVLDWIGGRHQFALPIGSLRAVQDALGEGPAVTLMSLTQATARVDAPFVVLRNGLVGGGMNAVDATTLIDRLADLHGWMTFLPTAATVLQSALIGPPDDAVGEVGGAPPMTPETETLET